MKTIKKIIVSLIIIILLSNISFVYADDENEFIENNIIEEQEKKEIEASVNADTKPTLNSRRYVIYDRLSGRALYGKDEDKKTAMASTTKIMTAIIIVENCDLSEMVTVSKKAAGTGGSTLGIKENDKMTVEDLLYGLMLRSGNDAAVALAMHLAGTVDKFAELMNKKAKELNLNNTHFVTPHGLDDPEHYTTACELAQITDYALKNETILKIVNTKTTTIMINSQPRQINNTNELLGSVTGVYGVKTGFTNNAGRCLVTAVKRGDMDLIIVVLGADTRKDRAKDSVKLIEYAFKKYYAVNVEEIIKKEYEMWKQINENRIYINKGNNNIETKLENIKIKKIAIEEEPKIEIDTVAYYEAPVKKDERVGTIRVKIGEDIIEEIEIKVSNEVNKRGIIDYFNIIGKIYSGKIKIIN